MEKWDLYTCERVKTGQQIIRGDKIPKGLYRLVVHVCIFNHNGEMLIQRRQKTKSGWPGLWDFTVGGHVIAGESSQRAAERETMEELGIAVSFANSRPAVTPTFPNGFDDIYIANMDPDIESLELQKEEVLSARWADKNDVLAMIEDGAFIPYHPGLVELLFFLKDHPEVHTA